MKFAADMNSHCKLCAILIFFLAGTLYADDEYRWNFINALTQNDFNAVENILKENVKTMSATDKRLVMSFALTYSYGENAIKAVRLLQDYNINPNNFDIYTAINRNQPDNVINLILSNNVKANGEILLLAMEKQRFDLAKQFIQTGVDVNYQYPLSKKYADGMTPLLYASKWNNFELVKLLVENGAKVNTRNKEGSTALALSRANENAQIYNYLIEQGAESTNSIIPPQQNTSGISGILNNQTANFQTGTYRYSGSNTYIKFSGSASSGSITYIRNGVPNNGSYRVESGYITIMMEGRTFTYKVDSAASFSGNGEVWVRTEN